MCVQSLGLLRQMRYNSRHIRLGSGLSTILTLLICALISCTLASVAFTPMNFFWSIRPTFSHPQMGFLIKSKTQDCRKSMNIQIGFSHTYYPTMGHITPEVVCYILTMTFDKCNIDPRLCFIVSF